MRPYRIVTLALCVASLSFACGKKDPPVAAAKPDAATGEPPALASGIPGFVAPPPGLVPEEADAGDPFGKEADWSKGTIPGTKITYKYPGDIFLMDEDKVASLLSSSIAVDSIQDDSGAAPTQYLFKIKLTTVGVGLVDAAKAERAPMFPDGKKEGFVEINGLAKKTAVGTRVGYMQRLIAHGFNTTVVLVELGPKKTLVAHVETVGEELRRRVSPSNWHPETWQLALVERVLATVQDPAAPPPPPASKPKDAGK